MAALTEIDICKLALSRLRIEVTLPAVSVVSGLVPANSKAERVLQLWYAQTVAELHEKVSWRAQTIDAALTLLDTAVAADPWQGKWAYMYLYPTNCADLRAVRQPGDPRKLIRQREYDIGQGEVSVGVTGRVIFADLTPLNVEYVVSPTAPTVYGVMALVCRAIAMRLAWNIAPDMGVADPVRQAVELDYMKALAEAMSKDANEAEDGDELPGDFATARAWG